MQPAMATPMSSPAPVVMAEAASPLEMARLALGLSLGTSAGLVIGAMICAAVLH